MDEVNEVQKKFGNKIAGKYTELVFECTVCKKVYKKPGMCHTCNAMLKLKGE